LQAFDTEIVAYLQGVVAESGNSLTVTSETELLETGLLDSINLVRLVQFLEERFGIRISDADLGVELFATPAAISSYVEQRLAKPAA
jgi:acyl carrier protein